MTGIHGFGTVAFVALIFMLFVRGMVFLDERQNRITTTLENFLGWTFFVVVYHALLIFAVWAWSQ